MTVREYIGARYVPLFMGEWDIDATYEPLSIVQYQGNSYTSRQFVPNGIPITNGVYWAETGNYNAQVEAYRQEVLQFDDRITQNSDDIDAIELKIGDENSGMIKDIADNAANITTLADDFSQFYNDEFTPVASYAPHMGIYSKCGRDFGIKDRWIIDRDNTGGDGYYTDRITSVQNGIAFKQSDTLYYAQLINKDADGYNSLYIRNMDTHQDVSILPNVTNYHDPSMSYIDNIIYLVDDTNKLLIKVNVTNVLSPSMTTHNLFHVTHYDLISFISDNVYCGLSADGTTLDFYQVGASAMISQLTLSSPAMMQDRVIQSMYVNDDYIVFAHWQPNAVSIFDRETGKHIKTIGMETWYDFIPCQEVESATICDNVMYVNLGQSLEGYNLPCVLYMPLDDSKTFRPATDTFITESNDTGTYRRQVYVNNTTGKLFIDENYYPNRFYFRFATDAANMLRSIGSGGTINISGADYPRFIALFDGVFRIAHVGSVNTNMHGLRFVNCVVSITDWESFVWNADNKYNDTEYNAIYCLACVFNGDINDSGHWRSIQVGQGHAPSGAHKRLCHLRHCISTLQSPKNCRIEYGFCGLRYNDPDTDAPCYMSYACITTSETPNVVDRD